MPPTTTTGPIARLAELCDESGLTRSAIAERAGMSRFEISRLLAGNRDPKLSTVARVLEAIDCGWADLDRQRPV